MLPSSLLGPATPENFHFVLQALKVFNRRDATVRVHFRSVEAKGDRRAPQNVVGFCCKGCYLLSGSALGRVSFLCS